MLKHRTLEQMHPIAAEFSELRERACSTEKTRGQVLPVEASSRRAWNNPGYYLGNQYKKQYITCQQLSMTYLFCMETTYVKPSFISPINPLRKN